MHGVAKVVLDAKLSAPLTDAIPPAFFTKGKLPLQPPASEGSGEEEDGEEDG